jgi:hypothetical protein
MKTRLIFLVLLIVCFSCETNNQPLSDAQKEKIKGEIKKVVNTFIKGIEEANADMVMESFLDSPDFVDITNGMVFSYNDLVAMKPNFDPILNQKCTIVNEKYAFLDKLTVLYTAETKWSTNYKDGHSSVTDPQAFLIIFKKIDKRWKVIYLVDSNVEKNVPREGSKGFDQIELFKQFTGVWKGEIGKDTIFTMEIKSFYDGFETYVKTETKGKLVLEERALMGYDKKSDKLIESGIINNSPEIILWALWFTSEKKCEEVLLADISNPENAILKWEFELITPNSMMWYNLKNNKITGKYTFYREK